MSDGFFDQTWEQAVAAQTVIAVRDVAALSASAPPPVVSVAETSGALEQLWRVPLADKLQPQNILAAADRVLVDGADAWHLFDLDGNLLAGRAKGDSNVFVDAKRGLFYCQSALGDLLAYRLTDGGLTFFAPLDYGDQFARRFLAVNDAGLLLLGIGQPAPHAEPPQQALLQALDFGRPPVVNESDRELESLAATASLTRHDNTLLMAVHGETLVAAGENHLYHLDTSLNVRLDFGDRFLPLALSVDDRLVSYLLVRTETGGDALWAVDAEGRRFVRTELPPDSEPSLAPLIGPDYGIYLLLGHSVIALDPGGELRWHDTVDGEIVGALVGADGELLVAAGAKLTGFAADRQRHELYDFGDEAVATAPLLDSAGDVLVATDRRLYRLTAAP